MAAPRKNIPGPVGRRIQQLRNSIPRNGLRKIAGIITSEFGPQHKYSHTHIGEYLKGRLPTSAAAPSTPRLARQMPRPASLVPKLRVPSDIPTSSTYSSLQKLANVQPTNPFTSSPTPQGPFSAMNTPADWTEFPQDDNEFITNNYAESGLERFLGSSIAVQPPKRVDPIGMLTAAMNSKFIAKLYSHIDSMADTATNNILGIRNTESNSNPNTEKNVRNALPSEIPTPEGRMQYLIDEVKSIKEERAKASEKQRQDTEKKLFSIQEEISEQMRKDFAPKTTDLSKVGEQTSSNTVQVSPPETVNVSNSTNSMPGLLGNLQSQPNVDPSKAVDATVSVNLNDEVSITKLPEKSASSLPSAITSTADGVSYTPKIATSTLTDSTTSITTGRMSETIQIEPESTLEEMNTDNSRVENSAEDSLQSSNSNSRVVQPNSIQAPLPPQSSRLSVETRPENSDLEAGQSQNGGVYQLLKVAFVVVIGVGVAKYLFDPKVRQWVFSHYIRLFQSSQRTNPNDLTTTKPPPPLYSAPVQTPRYNLDGTHVF